MSNKDQALSSQEAELLGQKIKRARQEIGYSQRELGQVLQLSDKTISSYEVGRAQPSLKTLLNLSKVAQKPISYFLEPVEQDVQDIDLQLRIKRIEQELLAIKKSLKI